MITRTQGYKVGEAFFTTIEAAQKAELESIINAGEDREWCNQEVALWIIQNSERVLDILTTAAKSRPSARKANGGTKTRKKTICPSTVQEFNKMAGEAADAMREKMEAVCK